MRWTSPSTKMRVPIFPRAKGLCPGAPRHLLFATQRTGFCSGSRAGLPHSKERPIGRCTEGNKRPRSRYPRRDIAVRGSGFRATVSHLSACAVDSVANSRALRRCRWPCVVCGAIAAPARLSLPPRDIFESFRALRQRPCYNLRTLETNCMRLFRACPEQCPTLGFQSRGSSDVD